MSILVCLVNLQSIKPEYIPLPIVNKLSAEASNSTMHMFPEQRNSSLLKVLNQTLNPSENVNVTSRDKAVFDQINSTSENQTSLAANGLNNTSANGTNTEILTNASQQPQPILRPLLSLMPPPPQSRQQQPSALQQPLLQSPLNLIPPQSLQQPSPLPLLQPSQRPPLPLLQPSQQPSTIIPPPSTPLYPVPSFPMTGSNYQPPVILSQNSYHDSTGSMHIVGEVLNQSPATARSVKIIATFYNANGQAIGTESTYADPSQLGPGQRAPFEMIAFEGSVPIYQMSYYGLRVDS